MKRIGLFLMIGLMGLGTLFPTVKASASETIEVSPVRLYVFHSEFCPHCKEELDFLEKLKKQVPFLEVQDFLISNSGTTKDKSLFRTAIDRYDLEGSVPLTVIGEQAIVGFDDADGKIGNGLKDLIRECSLNSCDSWLDEILGNTPPSKEPKKYKVSKKSFEKVLGSIEGQGGDSAEEEEGDTKKVSLFGKEWNVGGDSSILVLGVVLGLADGVNPCMFSVLIFLLTYLIAIGSRKRALKAGIVFAVTTFMLYFLFMFGIFKIVDVFEFSGIFRRIIIALSFFVGAIMLKDFFFYGKWVSLEISDRFKPTIEKLIKKGTVPSAFLLAIFAGIVEIPCTSGLPLAYVAALTERETSLILPLVWYNLFFIVPLLAIVFGFYFAWAKVDDMEKMRKKSRKYMRLVSGVLLIVLGIALLNGWL